MSNNFKKGDVVVYSPGLYDQKYAVFLHYCSTVLHRLNYGLSNRPVSKSVIVTTDEAFIRLGDTKELKRVSLNYLHPKR